MFMFMFVFVFMRSLFLQALRHHDEGICDVADFIALGGCVCG